MEAQWEQLRREAEAVVADHFWAEEAGVWIRGETIIESKESLVKTGEESWP